MSEHIPRHVLRPADPRIVWKRRNNRENATRTENLILHFLLLHHKNATTNRQLHVQNNLQWFYGSKKMAILSLQMA